MTLHSIFAKYSFISMFIISTSDERVYEGYKSNAIYRIRKFFYVTFHFDTITMLHSARSTHFFISILITTNERIYIKNLEFINFDIFASKEILRNLDTLSLYKIYIISLVIIINDEKKYIKIYIDWKVGMKNSVRGFEMFDWRNGTRVPPSDVPNFQKKVRALSCYTVVPLCRKQSIKEVSLY